MGIDFENNVYILDGALGTMLQKSGMKPEETSSQFVLRNPDVCKDIHKKYIHAGADIIYAATFGINRYKQNEFNMPVDEALGYIIDIALSARAEASKEIERDVYIALDIGPAGELLEPMGTLSFEEAYDIFSEVVISAKNKGIDLIVIETMTDLYETKAAVLAAKENSQLPVIVSMSFEEDQRTFTGVSLESMAVTLEGLGVDAIGINCSLGPSEILPMAKALKEITDLPVFAKPNAGMPDPATGDYGIDANEFSDIMKNYIDTGINMIGGCCGTTPEYISNLAKYRDRNSISDIVNKKKKHRSVICSSTKTVNIDHVTVIGERINPTGKKRLKQALLDGDLDYVMNQAIEQTDAGAEILDVNIGVPSLDEVEMLPRIVKKLQSITSTPLQIDSSNPEAIGAALRVYNGKAIVNSVNGDDDIMDSVLPYVAKYGASVIGLTLDRNGIPPDAEGRFHIAEHILDKAHEYGIPDEDVIIDCLTLTVSAQQKEAAETIKAVKMVHEKLGLKTALGISNISFGLPARVLINRTFLALAMENGLDLPIINPNDEDMMSTVYAFNVLRNIDENAAEYIERYNGFRPGPSLYNPGTKEAGALKDKKNKVIHDISYCVENGLKKEIAELIHGMLNSNSEMDIINNHLIPALDKVGKGFESGRLFLPQMLQAAAAAQVGFSIIKEKMAENGDKTEMMGEIVMATVKGDIHDIGKNIVKVILENYGFKIIDLGKDVPKEQILKAVIERECRLLGLSALMTTTLKSMEETITAVKEKAPYCTIMVGGAVLTEEYAHKIGADFYCADAMRSVEVAQNIFV